MTGRTGASLRGCGIDSAAPRRGLPVWGGEDREVPTETAGEFIDKLHPGPGFHWRHDSAGGDRRSVGRGPSYRWRRSLYGA